MLNTIINIVNKGSDFQQLFFKRELETLSDKANWNIKKLAGILLLTLLALGFSLGGLKQLEKRMSNPFTNWVNLPISSTVEDERSKILSTFQNKIYKDSFLLDNISEYAVTRKPFINMDNGKVYDKKGRTVESSSILLEKVLESENLVKNWTSSSSIFDNNECGIIVKRAMLDDLGYSFPLSQRRIALQEDDGRAIFLDILAVVEELPDRADFICHSVLYNMLTTSWGNTGFIEQEGTFNILHAISTKEQKEAETLIQERFKEYKVRKVKSEPIIINEQESHYYYQIIFHPIPAKSIDSLTQFYKVLNGNTDGFSDFIPYYQYNCNSSFSTIKRPHHMAFNFAQLDQVRSFKNFMQQRFEVEVDMNQVESKENFSLVSNLTRLTVLALILFSLLSIWLFVNNLLKVHLERVKPNLGTFKAFGLSNRFLTSAYLKIIVVFILIATLFALLIASVIAIIDSLINPDTYFNLFNGWILLALITLMIFSLIFSRQTINRILEDTPGNLIYGRG